jgi:hypothetical protein
MSKKITKIESDLCRRDRKAEQDAEEERTLQFLRGSRKEPELEDDVEVIVLRKKKTA